MKRTAPTLTLLAFVLGSALVGAARAGDKVRLALHLTKGDSRQMTVSLEQLIQQTVRSTLQETRQTVSVTYTFAVNDVDAGGNATVSVRYDGIAFHATTPTGPVDYDSAKPASGQSPPMASGLAALVSQSYTMTVSPQGTITRVAGLQKMLDAVLARLNLPEGPLRAAAEKAVRQQLSEANLKQSLAGIFAPFPDHAVDVGESWSRDAQMSQGFPMKIHSTYTLQSVEEGVATVKVSGTAATLPDAAMDLGPMKMAYDLKGEQSGSVQIVVADGWTRKAEVAQHLSGSATLRGPNVDPQTIPVTIESTLRSAQR